MAVFEWPDRWDRTDPRPYWRADEVTPAQRRYTEEFVAFLRGDTGAAARMDNLLGLVRVEAGVDEQVQIRHRRSLAAVLQFDWRLDDEDQAAA